MLQWLKILGGHLLRLVLFIGGSWLGCSPMLPFPLGFGRYDYYDEGAIYAIYIFAVLAISCLPGYALLVFTAHRRWLRSLALWRAPVAGLISSGLLYILIWIVNPLINWVLHHIGLESSIFVFFLIYPSLSVLASVWLVSLFPPRSMPIPKTLKRVALYCLCGFILSGIGYLLWAMIHEYSCITETRKTTTIEGFSFVITETDCKKLAEDSVIKVFGSKIGDNKTTLLLEYVRGRYDDPLPSIVVSREQKITISVPVVSSVEVKNKHYKWQYGAIDYVIPAPNPLPMTPKAVPPARAE